MSKTEKTSIEFSDLNVTLSLDTDNFPEELKTPLSQTYDPESSYAMSGVAIGEALKPVYDKISTVLGGVDQTYSPRSASAQSGIAVKQAIDDVENRIKEFDNALEGCNDAVIMAREAANRAAASSISAQKSASTAVFAKSDLETARDTAVSAATTATDAASAASSVKSYLETARDTAVSAAATATNAAAAAATSETNSTTAASTATAQAEAAAASATQADTDARACAIYDQRVSANATRAETAQQAAAASETAAAASATAAAAIAQELLDEELGRMVDIAIEAYGLMELSGVDNGYYVSQVDPTTGRARLIMAAGGLPRIAATILVANYNFNASGISYEAGPGWSRVLYLPKTTSIGANAGFYLFDNNKDCYFHAPALVDAHPEFNSSGIKKGKVIMSKETKFEYATNTTAMCLRCGKTIIWSPGTTFSKTKNANMMFQDFRSPELPDTFTFEAVESGTNMFNNCSLTKLPAAMELPSLTNGTSMFYGCKQLEVEDLVRVCLTINDLQALETPKTGKLGLPVSCMHNGETVATQAYLNANHPDFLTTLAAKGWTVSFA